MSARFRSVVLDADSTLAALEGIDWLGAQRGPQVGAAIEALTRRAMDGTVPLEQVYAERLALIRPTRVELAQLALAYEHALVPGAAETVRALVGAGVRCAIVSGGLFDALVPMAQAIGIAPGDVHAVRVRYDNSGAVEGLDGPQPLATAGGKPQVVQALALPRPILAVGDGMTDAALAPHVEAFAAFTGVERRPAVVAAAAHELSTFAALRALVLP